MTSTDYDSNKGRGPCSLPRAQLWDVLLLSRACGGEKKREGRGEHDIIYRLLVGRPTKCLGNPLYTIEAASAASSGSGSSLGCGQWFSVAVILLFLFPCWTPPPRPTGASARARRWIRLCRGLVCDGGSGLQFMWKSRRSLRSRAVVIAHSMFARARLAGLLHIGHRAGRHRRSLGRVPPGGPR